MLYFLVLFNLTYVYYVAFVDMDCLYTFEYILYYNFAFQFVRFSCVFLFRSICEFCDRLEEIRRNIKIQDLMKKSRKSIRQAEKILEEHLAILDTVSLSKSEIKIIRSDFSTRNSIDQSRFSDEQKKTCVICLGDFSVGESITIHPECKHIYHSDCLSAWLV